MQPPLVSAGFWEDDGFCDGFLSQHIGKISRAYRKHPDHIALYGRDGISQEVLGGWFNISQAQVSRIENGPPIRNLDTLSHWARTLRIPPHLLWFKLQPAEEARFSEPDGDRAAPHARKVIGPLMGDVGAGRVLLPVTVNGTELFLPVDGLELLREGAEALLERLGSGNALRIALDGITDAEGALMVGTPRRELLKKACAALTLPVLALDDLKRVVAAVDDARRYLDRDVVAHFRRQLAESAADDGSQGPKRTLPTVLGILGAIESSARRVKPSVRRELLAVGARGAEFAGWLYRDIGAPEAADHWRDRATEWAQESGDTAMQGYVLLKKSQAAWDSRDGLRMLTLAQAVQDGPWDVPLKVQAEAAQQEARGHAMVSRDLSAIERKLAEANELIADLESHDDLEKGPAGEELSAHYDSSLLDIQTAICYCEAGQPQNAIDIYQKKLSAHCFSRRDYGYFLSLMGGSLAVAAEPDEAATIGLEALEIGMATNSMRTMNELFRSLELLTPWSNRPAVQTLREALISATCAASGHQGFRSIQSSTD